MAAADTRWISQREGERLLGWAGLGDRHARRLLATGLAGEPIRTPGVTLYSREAVETLCLTPPMSDHELDVRCPYGLFVARRDLDVRRPWAARAATVADGWVFSALTAVWLFVRTERHGSVPLVATVGGYVTFGADVVGVDPVCLGDRHERGLLRRRLLLVEPGDWFHEVRRRRVLSGPGREWWIRGLDRDRGRLPS